MHEAQKAFPDVARELHATRSTAAVADVDAVIVVTPWKEFADVPELIMKRAKPPWCSSTDGAPIDKASVAATKASGCNAMEFTDTPLEGAFLVDLKRIEDHRGFFARAWCRDEFWRRRA